MVRAFQVPKVLNAIFVAKKIFAERGITFEK